MANRLTTQSEAIGKPTKLCLEELFQEANGKAKGGIYLEDFQLMKHRGPSSEGIRIKPTLGNSVPRGPHLANQSKPQIIEKEVFIQ